VGLIQEMLNWEPRERPSMAELPKHEWFRDLE
jgi:serine/threonine protein kinase